MTGLPKDRTLADWIRELESEGKLYRFYKTPEWAALRDEVLEDHHHECKRCKEQGHYSYAFTVHHDIEVRDRPDLALTRWITEPDGTRREILEPICMACHNAEHGRDFNGWRGERKPPLTEERW